MSSFPCLIRSPLRKDPLRNSVLAFPRHYNHSCVLSTSGLSGTAAAPPLLKTWCCSLPCRKLHSASTLHAALCGKLIVCISWRMTVMSAPTVEASRAGVPCHGPPQLRVRRRPRRAAEALRRGGREGGRTGARRGVLPRQHQRRRAQERHPGREVRAKALQRHSHGMWAGQHANRSYCANVGLRIPSNCRRYCCR